MGQKTDWMGLWNTRPAVYRSKPMTQAQIKALPSKCRIVLRENKFHKSNDDGTPRFVFCFADAETSDAISFKMENYSDILDQLISVADALDNAIDDASSFVDKEDLDAYSVWCCLKNIRVNLFCWRKLIESFPCMEGKNII